MIDWSEVLAKDVLPRYGWRDALLTPLSSTNNHVFRAQWGNSAAIVRLQTRPIVPAQLASELAWLAALDAAGLCVAKPLTTQDGALFVAGEAHGTTYHAALFAVLSGTLHTPDTLTLDAVAQVAELVAGLHRLPFVPDTAFERPRLDAHALFAPNGIYPLVDEAALFSSQQRAVMDEVAARVQAAMSVLETLPEAFGLIHGDLLLPNLLFSAGRACALDFEYCGWGVYLYDLTPLLWQLKPLPDYDRFAAAYWDAYVAQQPHAQSWHVHLETLIAGRQLASVRWLVGHQGGVNALAAHRLRELEGFLADGVLRRTLPPH